MENTIITTSIFIVVFIIWASKISYNYLVKETNYKLKLISKAVTELEKGNYYLARYYLNNAGWDLDEDLTTTLYNTGKYND